MPARESDTRNYYDMIAARQAIDLRPKLERLDDLILRSAGVDPAALSFEFRPLWQMDAAASATIALQKAQATQIYAGLNLWPAAVTAKLVEAQLAEDGTYPGAEGIFAATASPHFKTTDAFPASSGSLAYLTEPREPNGRWMKGVGGGSEASEKTFPPESALLGKAPDGTSIEAASNLTGFTRHGLNQTINRSVSPKAILDAINCPTKIRPRADGTVQYLRRSAGVVLNPQGQVVTSWRRGGGSPTGGATNIFGHGGGGAIGGGVIPPNELLSE